MSKRRITLFLLTVFSLIETLVAVLSIGSIEWELPLVSSSNYFRIYSPELGAAGWATVVSIVLQGRAGRCTKIRRLFAQEGLGADVYDLMMGMRGGTSRLALLQHMETPRHKHELSELTGIDWKEVNRELGLLEEYGLVKMYAQSGTIRLYRVTEQGSLLVKLIVELNAKRHV